MKQKRAKADYDPETDTLYVRPLHREYSSSVDIDNYIFDLDGHNKVVGIEILDASKEFGVHKVFLKKNFSGSLELDVGHDYMKIRLVLSNSSHSSSLNVERLRPGLIEESGLRLSIA